VVEVCWRCSSRSKSYEVAKRLASQKSSNNSGTGNLVCFLVPPRVGRVVDPRMSRQLVRATETLAATWELASMWLFTSMSPDVSRLVFKSVEGSVA
jgi:hypothetical protein